VTSKPDFKVMVLLLVFMQLTRDLFAIAKFLLLLVVVVVAAVAAYLADMCQPVSTSSTRLVSISQDIV